MHQTLFTSKYFDQKVIAFEINNIPNLEYKISVLNRWVLAIKNEKIHQTNETQIDVSFLNDIFGEVLGYDYKIENTEKNLLHKNSIDGKIPDAVLGFFDQDKKDIRVIIELKDSKTDLDRLQNRIERITPITQAFEYARKAGTSCKWVIVSNFISVRLYNKESDKYEVVNLIDLEDSLQLKRFFYLFHADRLFLKNEDSQVDLLYKGRIEDEIRITNEFYADFKAARIQLFEHIRENNFEIPPLLILEKTQKILDRIVFICFCKDSSIIPNSIRDILNAANASFVYDDIIWFFLKQLFTSIDKGNKKRISALNGGLFKKDTVLDEFLIKDYVLTQVLKLADYDYHSDLNVNILGHIFEQSISDLEKMRSALQNGENIPKDEEENTGKRKTFGVFYTPEYVTDYMIDESVGKWLKEIRIRLGELDLPNLCEADYDLIKITRVGTLKTNAKIEAHKVFWNNYLEQLKQISILDPACGSGAFLVQCFDYLLKEYKLVQKELALLSPPEPPQEFKNKFKNGLDLGVPVVDFDIDDHILKNNLYGVDVNFESIAITKLALWLKTVKRGKLLSDIDYSIQHGNSLIDNVDVSEKAFDWQTRFDKVMQKGGFDVIVGNPPYVDIKQISKTDVDYFFNHYTSCENRINLYAIFIEKGISLLKENGILSFINPNSFLINSSYFKLRQLLYDGIFKIVKMPDTVFVEVNVETAIFMYQKNKNHSSVNTYFYDRNAILTKIKIPFYKSIEKCNWNDHLLNYNIYTTDTIQKLIQNCYKNAVLLDEVSDFSLGITPYDAYQGHTPEMIQNRVFHSKSKIDNTYQALISGKNIHSYIITNEIKEYIQYGDWLGAKREERFFTEPRIIIRQILAGKKSKIVASYSNKPLYFTQIGFGILPKTMNFDVKYILALLNSSLINFIHRYRFLDIQKNTFQRILIENCKLLPISEISLQDQTPFIEKVDILINISEKLNAINENFTDLLVSDLQLKTISTRLDHWFKLSWSELNIELNKQKKKNISLKELSKWKTFFEEQQPLALQYEQVINTTQLELDQMIFQLYQLSDAEIQIIEEDN